MIALILVAVSLGLSNFAAAIGIGISGTGPRTRLRVGIVFGVFEAGMPIAGLALGRGLAGALGGSARWVSAGVLIATGAWTVLQAARTDTPAPRAPADHRPGPPSRNDQPPPADHRPGPPSRSHEPPPGAPADQHTGRLIVTGLALSVDNLAVGFALGAFRVSLPVAIVVIGAVSVALSLLGLELGARIGTRLGRRGEILGGLVLIAVGGAIAAGLI